MTKVCSGNISQFGEEEEGGILSGRARRGDFTQKQSYVQGLENLQGQGDVDSIPALAQPGI